MSDYWLDVPRCQHVKDDGIRCGSPALRGQPFCYNHDQIHHPRHVMGDPGYQIPVLETHKSVELAIRQVLQACHDNKITDLRARTMIYGIQVLAPYACQNQHPIAAYVATELPPAMQRLCGADTLVREPITTVCHPERGRTSESKDPDAAEPSTEPCTADTPVRDSRVAATDNSPARSAGNPPINLSSPVGTADTPLHDALPICHGCSRKVGRARRESRSERRRL